jgi:hypothetical protein
VTSGSAAPHSYILAGVVKCGTHRSREILTGWRGSRRSPKPRCNQARGFVTVPATNFGQAGLHHTTRSRKKCTSGRPRIAEACLLNTEGTMIEKVEMRLLRAERYLEERRLESCCTSTLTIM